MVPSRTLRYGLSAAGVGFMGLAFWHAWADVRSAAMPTWPAVLAAFAAIWLGLVAAGRSWLALFEGPRSAPALLQGFYRSQLGKYVPGGIWQPISQVVLVTGGEVSIVGATTLVVVHLLAQLVAGAILGSGLGLFGGDHPAWVRALAICGLAGLPLLDRRWMAAVARRIGAWRGVPVQEDAIPSQGAILRSCAWACLTLVGSGAGLTVLLVSLGSMAVSPVVVPAFALAWVTGCLAVPFPSGLGVREAMLLLVVPGGGVVVASAVIHRLVTITAEGTMILLTRSGGR